MLMISFKKDIKRIASLLAIKNKLILYHRDIDGTTSAALLLKFFPADSRSLESPRLGTEALYAIKEKKPDLLIFLDLAIDQDWKQIKALEKTAKILVIDHHLFDKDLNSSQTCYLNPRLSHPKAYLSTSYLVYHLLKKLKKPVQGYAWIAALGVIGDYAFEEGKDVLDEARRGDESLLRGEPRESRLGEGGKLISAAITARGEKGAEKALQALMKASQLQNLEGDQQLEKWEKTIREEVERVVESFEREKEWHPQKNLAILDIKSKFSVTSIVSTILAEKHPDLTIIVRRRVEEGSKLSFRNQSGNVNLNDLVKRACKGIGQGGGHEKAAGAFVTDWETFRKRFLKLLK